MTSRLALVLMIAGRAWACSCGGNWPSVKQAWEKTPFVFLGTVELANPDEDPNQTIFQEQFVRIRVDEAFKGVSQGQIIELHEGANDCAEKFRTGQRAVFYLYKEVKSGTWVVPVCTRSLGNAEPGGDDLLFLRGLPKSAIGTRLSGEVELYEDSPSEAFRRAGGVPNVRVTIVSPTGVSRDVVTNRAGAYEVFGLQPGRYSIHIDVPKGLKIKFPSVTGSPRIPSDPAAAEITENGSASVGFVLQADTRLSGRMLDAKGVPVKGVCIDLDSLQGRGENGASFFNCSKADGAFEMAMMRPGEYILVARDHIEGALAETTSTLYYPGVRNRERATVISIEAGKYLEHLDIRLPSDEKRFNIAGRFEFADGVAVAGGIVTFTSPQHGYSDTTSTGPDGAFVLPVVAGMEGQLNGRLSVFERILASCPQFKVAPERGGMFRAMNADPIPLSTDSERQDIKLKLLSPSCDSWPARR